MKRSDCSNEVQNAEGIVVQVTVLSGLPGYGPMPRTFPPDWGRLGREGVVVQFKTEAGTWIGNFKPGLGGINLAEVHPNRRDAVVVAAGDLWVVNPKGMIAELLLPAIDAALEVREPDGWVFSRQGLAFARLAPEGLIWHTRRLSWDGFDKLAISSGELTGLAWSPLDDKWHVFRVDLRTGRSTGGSFGTDDSERWEKCLT